jgi:hypothetical protein
MNNARMFGRQEDRCESAIRGHSGTADARLERQSYATKVVQEWQRTHPTLEFSALVSFFRLAGKDYDRNSRYL